MQPVKVFPFLFEITLVTKLTTKQAAISSSVRELDAMQLKKTKKTPRGSTELCEHALLLFFMLRLSVIFGKVDTAGVIFHYGSINARKGLIMLLS